MKPRGKGSTNFTKINYILWDTTIVYTHPVFRTLSSKQSKVRRAKALFSHPSPPTLFSFYSLVSVINSDYRMFVRFKKAVNNSSGVSLNSNDHSQPSSQPPNWMLTFVHCSWDYFHTPIISPFGKWFLLSRARKVLWISQTFRDHNLRHLFCLVFLLLSGKASIFAPPLWHNDDPIINLPIFLYRLN